MRHFTLAFMMAVALLLAGGASALPSSGINPSSLCTVTSPVHVPFVAGTANGVSMPGATANYCLHYAELRGLLDSTLFGSPLCADPAYTALCGLLVPCISDINGEVIIDERASTPSGNTEIYVTGNGIFDASNELSVLKRILTTPSFNNGVLTYAQVLAAYEHNFYQIQCDLGVLNIAGLSTLYPTVLSGIVEIVAAHITIGDGALVIDTTDPTGNVTTATGSWGVASGIAFLLCGLFADAPFNNPCPNANLVQGDYVLLDSFLSAAGDADGDGATNVEEALWYTQASCGTVTPPAFPPNPGIFVTGPSFVCPPATGTTYIDAALSPSLTPLDPAESFFIVSNPAFVETGQDVALKVTTAIPGLDLTSPSVTYQWKLGVVDVVDGPGVTGATTQTLTFTGATAAIDGTYFCLVDYSTVNPAVLTKPFVLTVLPLGSVPVGGGLAMGLLAGACALAGAMGIRRKS